MSNIVTGSLIFKPLLTYVTVTIMNLISSDSIHLFILKEWRQVTDETPVKIPV